MLPTKEESKAKRGEALAVNLPKLAVVERAAGPELFIPACWVYRNSGILARSICIVWYVLQVNTKCLFVWVKSSCQINKHERIFIPLH